MHAGVRRKLFTTYRVVGGGYKRNVRCPNCGSTARVRLLRLFFELRTDVLRTEKKVLHISPNRLLGSWLQSNRNIQYTCGALNPGEFKELGAIALDATRMSIDDGLFDIVLCNHVLEHVRDDAAAMREIHRVLKQDGYAIIQAPLALNLPRTIEDAPRSTPAQRKDSFGGSDHVRLYGLDYFDRLRKAGFRVVRDNPFQNSWASDLERHRLEKDEDVVICYKR